MQAQIETSTDSRPAFLWRDTLGTLPAVEYYSAGSSLRPKIEHYITQIFHQTHGAVISEYQPMLFSLERDGEPLAALGLRKACNDRLFSEIYLDGPIERYISELYRQPCSRADIIEFGNLVASEPRQSAQLYLLIVAAMLQAGIRYIVFTANRLVRASIKRCGFTPLTIAGAEQSRLGDKAKCWGSYYSGTPVVMVADTQLTIAQAHAQPAMYQRLGYYHQTIDELASIIRGDS